MSDIAKFSEVDSMAYFYTFLKGMMAEQIKQPNEKKLNYRVNNWHIDNHFFHFQ